MRLSLGRPAPNGRAPASHVISRLLAELPFPTGDLQEKGKVLDNYYVATRYAHGHPEGAPFEHYGPLQSESAVRYAAEILEFVRARVA
jgi:HEPN domain-containing protein